MLVVMPDALHGRVGALLSALIVVLCVVGLTMHRDFYAGRPRRDFLCFYTNVSNALVLLYFALAAPRLYAHAALYGLIARAEFSLMMSIMLTFCVFHLLLFPPIRAHVAEMAPTRDVLLVCADNLILHYLVPWLVFLYWLLCSPRKSVLGAEDAALWTLLPLGYVACMLIRAAGGRIIEETQSPYPYPFLDVRTFGWPRVLFTCARLYALCILAGALLVLMIRLLYAGFGGGHALILI